MTIEYKKKGRASKKPPVEVLSKLYATHTAKEIAEQYEVSPETVKKWIATYRKLFQQEEVNTNA